MAHVNIYQSHFEREELAPFSAAPVTVTSGVGAWTVGSSSANILVTTTRIKITNVYFDPGAAVPYDIEIVDTAGTPNVLAVIHCPSVAGMVRIQSEIISSGTTIQARCQDSAGSNTIDVKIGYIVVS